MKKMLRSLLCIVMIFCMMLPVTSYAAKPAITIIGSSYPTAGDTYSYTAASFTNDIVSYKWTLSGISGGSIISGSTSKVCKVKLTNDAKGYGILTVTVKNKTNETASRTYGISVVSNPTTTPETTKNQTTTKVLTPNTTKKQTTTQQTTRKQTTTKKPPENTSKENTATTSKPERPNNTTKRETTTQGSRETTTGTTETTTAAVSEAVNPDEFAETNNVLSLKVTTNDNNSVTFEWKDNSSETYNLYLTKDGKNYFLVYSGSGNTHQISHLKKGETYKAVVESMDVENETIKANGHSDNVEFTV